MPSGSAGAMALALAAAAAAEASAFMVPAGASALWQGRARPAVAAGRPALRTGAGAVRAVYEPAIRIGHGFDIHRLGVCVCVCVCIVRVSAKRVRCGPLWTRGGRGPARG